MTGGRPRLAGPRVVLVPCPTAVARAVVAGGDVGASLAPLGLRPAHGWPHAGTADALRPHAEHGPEDGDADVWLVVDGEEVVGDCGLAAGLDERGEQEIGYGLARAARGRGLGTEAVAVLCAWLEQQPDVRRVAAEVEVGNVASQRLLARLGFVRRAAVPPYERWVRGEPEPVLRRLPPGAVTGRHVC